MCREKKYRGSKEESNWVGRYVGVQANKDEVQNDCCHVTLALGTFCSKGHVIIKIQ